ncbi:MAG: RNA polymerase sigma factor [Clostridiales bacterium]|nr:RNA polymerase sigma factor [Clostridiales bacterium]
MGNEYNNDIHEEYAELLERVRNGDESAFTEIYQKSERLVYTTCYRILNNKENAEDAMQETYLALYNNIDTIKDGKALVAWLSRTAYFRACDLGDKNKDNLAYEDAIANEELSEETDDLDALPESYVTVKANRDIISKIVKEELSESQYITTLLFYYNDLSISDIASMMNCPEGTIKTRLSESRRKIKKGIESYEKDFGDKLAGAAGVPFLTKFFIETSKELSIPSIKPFPSKVPVKPTATSGGSAASKAGQLSETGAKVAAKTSLPKIMGIVGAAVVGVGAIIATVIILNKDKKPVVTEPSETEAEEIIVETESSKDTEPADTTEAVETVDPAEWKQAYLEVVNSTTYSSFEDADGNIPDEGEFTFDLVYINDDDVPELLVCLTRSEDLGNYDKEMYEETGDVSYANLYTYTDGKVVELMHNTRVFVSYLRTAKYYVRENKIINTEGFRYTTDVICYSVTDISDDLESVDTTYFAVSWVDLEEYPDGWYSGNDYSRQYYYAYDLEADEITEITEDAYNSAVSGSGEGDTGKLVAEKTYDEIVALLS